MSLHDPLAEAFYVRDRSSSSIKFADTDAPPRSSPSVSPSPPRRNLSPIIAQRSASTPPSPPRPPLHRQATANALKAREERERKQRLSAANLTFDDWFAAHERRQAVNALSDEATMRRDLKKVRARLRASGRWLLNPDGSFLRIWDTFTLSALIFTMFVTPYEIGFLVPETTTIGLEAANIIVLFIFAVGIALQFFTPYRESYLLGGAKVKDHRRIAKRYLRGWFWLDFVSTIPYEIVANLILYGSPRVGGIQLSISQAAMTGAGSGTDASATIRMLRLLRLIRLLKLGRIGKQRAPPAAPKQLPKLTLLYCRHTHFEPTLTLVPTHTL